jgi:hypothetical protein
MNMTSENATEEGVSNEIKDESESVLVTDTKGENIKEKEKVSHFRAECVCGCSTLSHNAVKPYCTKRSCAVRGRTNAVVRMLICKFGCARETIRVRTGVSMRTVTVNFAPSHRRAPANDVSVTSFRLLASAATTTSAYTFTNALCVQARARAQLLFVISARPACGYYQWNDNPVRFVAGEKRCSW